MKFFFNFFKNLPANERRITLSTKLTLLRILLIPFIVFAMIYYHWLLAFILIIICSISDTLDGTLARLRNEKTILGSILDPLADKLFIVSCYCIFSLGYSPKFILPYWFTFFVLIKEFFLISGAIFLFMKNGFIEMRPTMVGKAAMDAHIFFIIWLFLSYFFDWKNYLIFNFFIYAIIILTISSLYQYARIVFKSFLPI